MLAVPGNPYKVRHRGILKQKRGKGTCPKSLPENLREDFRKIKKLIVMNENFI